MDTTTQPSFVGVVNGQLRINAGEQNYGDSVVRINQPFDWAGRTGTLTFDATTPQRDGWTQVSISQDPYPYVSFNEDNTFGPFPAEGLMIQFRGASGLGCVILKTWHVGAQTLNEQQCLFAGSNGDTLLNHIQLHVSTTRVQVSIDGRTLTWNTPIGFTRGYVYLDSHNHATEKYAGVPTWNTIWDNVSFDGPALPLLNVALPPQVLPANPSSPRLVLMVNHDTANTGATLAYALNGQPFHPIPLVKYAGQVNAFMVSQAVDPAELVAGSNTVTFTQINMTRPSVTNVQIVWNGVP